MSTNILIVAGGVGRQGIAKPVLPFPAPFGQGAGGRLALFQCFHYPGDEQEIAQPRLNGAGDRKNQVGQRIADRADTEFVAGIFVPEQVDDLHDALLFLFRVIQPGKL